MPQATSQISASTPDATGILLVEDNPGDAFLTETMLASMAQRPIAHQCASDIESTLQRLREASFDVVLLDSDLPDSQGYEGLLRIQVENPEIAIIMLSGNNDRDFAIGSVRLGVQDYLVKGEFETPDLEKAIAHSIERKRHEIRKHRYPIYDQLTGLPMRDLLADRWLGAVARAKRNHTGIALAFIDLDGFKSINDTHGHAVGDRVLQEVASRLSASVRASDTVVRYGGDEFLILLGDLASEEQANRVIQKARENLKLPIEVDTCSVICEGSVGIAYSEYTADTSLEDLVKSADCRMYAEKNAGRA